MTRQPLPFVPTTGPSPTGGALYESLFHTVPDAVYITTLDGKVVDANPAMVALFGYSLTELKRLDVFHLYVEAEERSRFQRQIAADGVVRDYPLHLRKKDGTILDCLLNAVVYRAASGTILGYQGIIRDVTGQRRLERAALDFCEAERRRIGCDLHDDLAQQIAGMALRCKGLEQALSKRGQTDLATSAQQMTAHLNRLVRHIRELVDGLVPLGLQRYGLSTALEQLATRTSDHSGIRCRFSAAGAVEGLTPLDTDSADIHLFRVAQEAVTNAVKHSRAKQIQIDLVATAERLTVTVTDDGVGLPETMPDDGSMGLQLMQYRARLISATLTIQNRPGGGTVVRCSAPRRRVR